MIRERATVSSSGAAEAEGLERAVGSSLEAIDALREECQRLREAHGLLSSWSDPERYCAEQRIAPADVQPHLAIFRDADGPRAMVLGRIATRRFAVSLGYWRVPTPNLRYLQVVHGGLITDGTEAARAGVLAHLRDLLAGGGLDAIYVNHLPVEHELHGALVAAGATEQIREPHWQFRLVPGSYEQTVGVFSSKHRREMRRMDRVLCDRLGEAKLRRFERPEELAEMVRGCAAIAARTYQAGLGVGFTGEQPWDEILKTEARLGRLRGYWLECGGEPVAFQIGAIHESVYFMDFMGYLPEHAKLGAGSVLHGRVLEDLCKDGMTRVDYGFGDAQYKQTYGTESREEALLVLYGRSWRARTTARLIGTTAQAKRWAKGGLNRLGLEERIKRHWRARLRTEKPKGEAAEAPPRREGRLRRALRKHGLGGTLSLAASKARARLFSGRAIREFQQQEKTFDRQHGIDTAGRVSLEDLRIDSPHAAQGNAYQPTSPQVVEEILESLPIRHEEFVFVDFGSGKGRVVLLASERPFAKVVGVEFSRQLHAVAEANLARFPAAMRRCGAVELLCMDATQYELPEENLVLYFYNPFERAVMKEVLENLERSLAKRPRTVYLVLVNVGYEVAPAGFARVGVRVSYERVVVLRRG